MGADVSPMVSHAGEIVAGVGAFVVILVTYAVLRLRRRLRALRSHTAVRSAIALASAVREGAGGLGPGPSRWRFELWQSVGAATRAVEGALRSGSAVADLPGLVRRLRATAEELDRLLGLAAGLPTSAPELAGLKSQVEEAMDAASMIRRAALASAADAAAVRIDELAADAGRELQSLSAGIARARAAIPRGGPLPGD